MCLLENGPAGANSADDLQKLKTGDAGTTKAQVKSAGVDLPIPTPLTGSVYFDQDPSVIVQLLSSEGMCLTSEFASANMLRNDATQFKGTAP